VIEKYRQQIAFLQLIMSQAMMGEGEGTSLNYPAGSVNMGAREVGANFSPYTLQHSF